MYLFKNSGKVFVKVLAFSFIAAAVPVLFSCSKKNNTTLPEQSSKTNQLILGFSQIGAESSWRTANTASIYKAAQNHDIQLLYDDAQQKQSNQLKAIRSFIVYQVDVIAFVPIVETGWDNVLIDAKEAGIPVIIIDRKIQTSRPDLIAGYIGENAFDEGVKAASYIIEKFKNINGPINVVEITGTENSSVAEERHAGFKTEIEKDQKFNIVYTECGDFLRSRGKEITDKIIDENNGFNINGKKIHVIVSHNDSMTLGVLESFREKEINSEELCIVSFDGEKEAVWYLKNGEIDCIIQCNPDSGEMLMDAVIKVAAGEPIDSVSYIQEEVLSMDNLEVLNSYIGF